MNIHAAARKLVKLMKLTHQPQQFLANYLAQDPTAHNAAVCILAHFHATKQIWRHPATPSPSPEQLAATPEWWRRGLHIAQQFDPQMDAVCIGGTLGMAVDPFEHWLLRHGPERLTGPLEGPSCQVTGAAVSDQNGTRIANLMVRKTPEDVAKEKASATGGHVVGSVKKRTGGSPRVMDNAVKGGSSGKGHNRHYSDSPSRNSYGYVTGTDWQRRFSK